MNRRRIADEVSTLKALHGRHTGMKWARNGRGRPFRVSEPCEWAGDSPAIHRRPPMIFNF